MDYVRISTLCTELSDDYVRQKLHDGCRGFHESLMRSYHILAQVKELLNSDTPSAVVLDLISIMEAQPQKEKAS